MADLLIHRDGQYEYNGILFNDSTVPEYKVEKVEGLYGTPDLRNADVQLKAAHGSLSGYTYYDDRIIEMDMSVIADDPDEMSWALRDLVAAMQITRLDREFVWKKAGLELMMYYARPKQAILPSTYDVSQGMAKGTLQWVCNDPIAYKYDWETLDIFVEGGTNNEGGTVKMEGTFADGVGPVLVIDGPTIDPIITSSTDGNKAIRLDVTLDATQTAIIDVRKKTVTDEDGVRRNNWLAIENQWWALLPGDNVISYTRTGTAGDSTCEVQWRDGYLL